MPALHGENVLFARSFRFAVNANRSAFIFFDVCFAFLTIENVIGAEVNKLRILVSADLRQQAGRFWVNAEGFFAMCFAIIDIRQSGAINDNVDIERPDFFAQLLAVSEIESLVSKTE